MSACFLTDLFVEKLILDTSPDQRGTWLLTKPLIYHSDVLDADIEVPSGFKTDFASVPRLPVAFLLAGDTGHESAVVHDWLYTTHRVSVPLKLPNSPPDAEGLVCVSRKFLPVSREMADAVFREALGCSGEEYRWRVWLMWAGVRIGGSRPYEMDGQKQLENLVPEMT